MSSSFNFYSSKTPSENDENIIVHLQVKNANLQIILKKK